MTKDFKRGSKELPSKEIMDILTQYGHPPKNHMQPLTDQELSIVFEYLTQHNQVDSIESIYADVYHEPAAAKSAAPAPAAAKSAAPAPKQPAQGQQQAKSANSQPAKQPAQNQSTAKPAAQSAKPQGQAQAPASNKPASRTPAKKVVDTRGGQAVNLEKYESGWRTSPPSASSRAAASRSSRAATPSASGAVSRAPATSAARRRPRRCAASSWRSPRRPP